MHELRGRFERFCLRHREKGIGNLMLVLAIGNLIVYALTALTRSYIVYSWLCFSASAILRGQVWRIVTYVFTYLVELSESGIFLGLISLYCYYQFGRILEQQWGRFRFNLYYLFGMLISAIAALILGVGLSATNLNLSLFLAIATLIPEGRVLLFFIIPIKMKYMAWVYLALTAFEVISGILTNFLSFTWLFPILVLLNYFLFFGSDILGILPVTWQIRRPRKRNAQPKPKPNANWSAQYQSKSGERPYRHKCTVCGRTDTEYPSLEFRYCPRCNGYHCYCIEHIQNHTHIQ